MPTQAKKTYTTLGAQPGISVSAGDLVSISTAVTATITYNIEVQLTDNGNWSAAAAMTGLTAGLAAQVLAGPVVGVRANVTALTGGSVTLEVLSTNR